MKEQFFSLQNSLEDLNIKIDTLLERSCDRACDILCDEKPCSKEMEKLRDHILSSVKALRVEFYSKRTPEHCGIICVLSDDDKYFLDIPWSIFDNIPSEKDFALPALTERILNIISEDIVTDNRGVSVRLSSLAVLDGMPRYLYSSQIKMVMFDIDWWVIPESDLVFTKAMAGITSPPDVCGITLDKNTKLTYVFLHFRQQSKDSFYAA